MDCYAGVWNIVFHAALLLSLLVGIITAGGALYGCIVAGGSSMYFDLFGMPSQLLASSCVALLAALVQTAVAAASTWMHFIGLRERAKVMKRVQLHAQETCDYGANDGDAEVVMPVFYYSAARLQRPLPSTVKMLRALGWTAMGFLAAETLLGLATLVYYPSYQPYAVHSFAPFYTVCEANAHESIQLNWADTKHRGSNLLLYQGDDIPTSINQGQWRSYAPVTESNISHVALRNLEPNRTYYYYIKYFTKYTGIHTFTLGSPADSVQLVFASGLKGSLPFSKRIASYVDGTAQTALVLIGGTASASISTWNNLLRGSSVLFKAGLVAIGRGTSDLFPHSDRFQTCLTQPVLFDAVVQPYQPHLRGVSDLKGLDTLLDRLPYSLRILYRNKDLPIFSGGMHYHFVRGSALVIVLDIAQDYFRAEYMGCPDFSILSGEQLLYVDEVLTKYSPEVHSDILYRFVTLHGELYQLYADIQCFNSLATALELLACQHNVTAIIGRGSDGFTLHNRTRSCIDMGHHNKLLVIQLPDAGGLSAWGRSVLRSYIGDFFQYFRGHTSKQRWPADTLYGPVNSTAYGASDLVFAATGNIVASIEVASSRDSAEPQCKIDVYDVSKQRKIYELSMVR